MIKRLLLRISSMELIAAANNDFALRRALSGRGSALDTSSVYARTSDPSSFPPRRWYARDVFLVTARTNDASSLTTYSSRSSSTESTDCTAVRDECNAPVMCTVLCWLNFTAWSSDSASSSARRSFPRSPGDEALESKVNWTSAIRDSSCRARGLCTDGSSPAARKVSSNDPAYCALDDVKSLSNIVIL